MDNTMKRSATYLLGVLLLLAAGSCSVQKKCKAPQLDMPAEIVAGQSDTLTLSARKWWEVYTDTTLCRLIGRTLDRNRNLLSAAAVWRMPSLTFEILAAFSGSANSSFRSLADSLPAVCGFAFAAPVPACAMVCACAGCRSVCCTVSSATLCFVAANSFSR